ncbi:MAG TPA: HAD family hydrolase [Vicinamibacterales bacterium]|nr:HAD family hydrolase [Vicinamibacterales bacterium]
MGLTCDLSTIDLFVFDLDGTLVDSRRDIAESANAVLVECGRAPHSEDTIGSMVGDGAAVLIARAFEAAGGPVPADGLERFLRIYNQRLLRHTRAYAGIPALLDALARRGTLAVLTNKPAIATRAILDGLGLAGFFGERVLGGDGPHPRKPDPAGLRQLMAGATMAAARTLMIGDSIVDVRTARGAGALACVARYGFGFQDFIMEELETRDLVIDSPLDLLNFL